MSASEAEAALADFGKPSLEIELDLLLQEEFESNPEFVASFLGACAGSRYSDIVVGCVKRSAVDALGEVDVRVELSALAVGDEALPADWLTRLELRTEIAQVGDDLAHMATGQITLDRARLLYPGW